MRPPDLNHFSTAGEAIISFSLLFSFGKIVMLGVTLTPLPPQAKKLVMPLRIRHNQKHKLKDDVFTPDVPDVRQPPLAAGELIANFSGQERLALYEYTLQNTASVAPPPELSMMVCILP